MVSQLIPPAVWQRFGIDYEFVLGYQSHMFIYSIKWYIQGGAVIHRFHIPLWLDWKGYMDICGDMEVSVISLMHQLSISSKFMSFRK